MAKNGLEKWFKQKWVILGASERMVHSQSVAVQNKRRTPKKISEVCPTCKSKMSEGQRRSAVARKRAAANVGPKPTNVKTFAKRTKAAKVTQQV